MTPRELQRKLRALPGGSFLTLKRDRRYAISHKLHPDAWQIWDQGHSTGRPLFVVSCELEQTGGPCSLDQRIVDTIARSMQRHNGRRSWINELERKVLEREQREEDEKHQNFVDARKGGEERVFHRAGHFRHWALDATMKPCV